MEIHYDYVVVKASVSLLSCSHCDNAQLHATQMIFCSPSNSLASLFPLLRSVSQGLFQKIWQGGWMTREMLRGGDNMKTRGCMWGAAFLNLRLKEGKTLRGCISPPPAIPHYTVMKSSSAATKKAKVRRMISLAVVGKGSSSLLILSFYLHTRIKSSNLCSQGKLWAYQKWSLLAVLGQAKLTCVDRITV